MKLTKSEHLIWTNDIDMENWKDFLEEEYPEVSDEGEQFQLVYDMNDEYLYDERENLNIQLNNEIIVIADLGLWYGRRMGYRLIRSGNIKDCLYDEGDYATWWVDRYKDLRCKATHHDGTNWYTYRVFKPDVSEKRRDRLLEKLYHGTATRRDVTKVTSSLGKYIARVYGW